MFKFETLVSSLQKKLVPNTSRYAQWLEGRPVHCRVTDLSPGQGHVLGLWGSSPGTVGAHVGGSQLLCPSY